MKTIWTTQLTQAAPTDLEGVGRLRFEDGKIYRWIKNNVTNIDLAANGLVCHTFTEGASSIQVGSRPATATLGYLGGVAMTTIYSSTGTNPLRYGWIQVLGINESVAVTPANTQTTAAPVSGDLMKGVDGQFWAATGTADGVDSKYARRIELLDSVAGAATVQVCSVYIHCM